MRLNTLLALVSHVHEGLEVLHLILLVHGGLFLRVDKAQGGGQLLVTKVVADLSQILIVNQDEPSPCGV